MTDESSEYVWIAHYFQNGEVADMVSGWDEDEVKGDIAALADMTNPEWEYGLNAVGDQSATAEQGEAKVTIIRVPLGEFI